MNRQRDPEQSLNEQQSSVESSQSYHRYHLLQSQLQRLEERVHKLHKSQKQTQKNLDSHMLDESTERQTIIKWLNQITSRLSDDSNSKLTKSKFQFPRSDSMQALDTKLADIKASLKKELKSQSTIIKEEINRIGKITKQVQDVKDSVFGLSEEQQVLKIKIEKLQNDRSVLQLQSKFSQSIEQGMNSIQQIIKNYINDQASIVIKIKALEEQIQEEKKYHLQKEIIQLTPRDIASVIGQKANIKSSAKNQNPSIQSQKKPPKQNFNSSTDKLKERSIVMRPNTIQRQSSVKNMSAYNQKQRQRSYSSKKITDLRQKLKQFQMINTKYKGQQSSDQNYLDEQALGSRASNASKPAKEAIQQLKQFKHMLQNTQSDMDISNTFNQDIMPKKSESQQKYRKLDKAYHN